MARASYYPRQLTPAYRTLLGNRLGRARARPRSKPDEEAQPRDGGRSIRDRTPTRAPVDAMSQTISPDIVAVGRSKAAAASTENDADSSVKPTGD